jgi:hypothetical protein
MYCTKFIEKVNNYLNNIPLYYYLIPFVIHIISTKLLSDKITLMKDHKPLYDIIMSNTPDLSRYPFIPNVFLIIISIFLIIPLFIKPEPKFFISLIKYYSIIILIRTITTQSTILPASGKCKSYGLYKYINGHCIDKVFSGHTAISLILILQYYRYNIVNINIIYLLLIIQSLLSLSLILTRGHYTIDIIIAYVISISLFSLLDL